MLFISEFQKSTLQILCDSLFISTLYRVEKMKHIKHKILWCAPVTYSPSLFLKLSYKKLQREKDFEKYVTEWHFFHYCFKLSQLLVKLGQFSVTWEKSTRNSQQKNKVTGLQYFLIRIMTNTVNNVCCVFRDNVIPYNEMHC
jgi:hypothetical protein